MKKNLSEIEIDDLVAAQADDDTKWENPIRVKRTKPVMKGRATKANGRSSGKLLNTLRAPSKISRQKL